MTTRSRNGGERLRTVWTPEMDRYFVDLMLREVNAGSNFDDHLFSKRAWKNMASMFNAKFEFQCEKDVLKNRHKTLRNLCRSVRDLLARDGFAWDKKKKMVTAENRVWEEFIKERPDARSLRIKSIPYYDDLCLIYRDPAMKEKGSTTELEQPDNDINADEGEMFDIIIDGDYEIAMVENEVDIDISQQSVPSTSEATSSSRTRTYWQPPMDQYFVDLMLDHVQKGNKIDGVFRKQAWIEMIASFNAKFGFHYDIDVLKNRYKTLKRQRNVIKNLLDLDGFVWDETRQMVIADDYVWQDYIKAHSDARQFMTRPIPFYRDLCAIFDSNSDDRDHFSDQDLDLKNKRRSENLSPCLSQPKRGRDGDDDVAGALREMATAVSSLSEKKQKDESLVSVESVIQAVQALADMDEDLVLDACDLLEDEKKAKTFMALDSKLRRKWLLRKLRP